MPRNGFLATVSTGRGSIVWVRPPDIVVQKRNEKKVPGLNKAVAIQFVVKFNARALSFTVNLA